MLNDKEIEGWLRQRNADEPGLTSHDYIQACVSDTEAYAGPEQVEALRYVKVKERWDQVRRTDPADIEDRVIGVPRENEEGQQVFHFWRLADINQELHEASLTARYRSVQRNVGRLLSEIRHVGKPPRSWQLKLPFKEADLQRLAGFG